MIHYLLLTHLKQNDNIHKSVTMSYILQNVTVLHILGLYIPTHNFTFLLQVPPIQKSKRAILIIIIAVNYTT
jgi:hypothetical protein